MVIWAEVEHVVWLTGSPKTTWDDVSTLHEAGESTYLTGSEMTIWVIPWLASSLEQNRRCINLRAFDHPDDIFANRGTNAFVNEELSCFWWDMVVRLVEWVLIVPNHGNLENKLFLRIGHWAVL